MKYIKRLWENKFILLYASLFSVMLVMSRHFIIRADSCFDAHLTDILIIDFHWFDVLAWFVLTVILSELLIVLVALLKGGNSSASADQSRPAAKGGPVFFLAVFVFLLISWLPYTLTFVPFGVYADTVSVIRQATGEKVLTNHHPVLYTFLWRAVISIGSRFGGEDAYLKLFSLLQDLISAAVCSYYIFWLRKQSAAKHMIMLSLFFFAFAPLVPLYVVSLWKDTLFCLALFAYTLWITDTICNHASIYAADSVPAGHLVSFALCSLLMIFLRNNGLYIFIASTVVVLLYLLSKYRLKVLPLAISSLCILLFSVIISGPVYDHFGLNIDGKVESLGIPLQQAAYIDVTDGVISEQDQAFLDKLIPKETLVEVYNPLSLDSTKWDDDFDLEFLNQNTSEFLRVYARLVRDNPGKAVKAYCMETFGFWSVTKSTANAYISARMFLRDTMFQTDYFEKIFGFSVASLIAPRVRIPYACFFWIALLMCAVLLNIRQPKYIIPFIPSLTGWATVMFATPAAFSFRYIYFLFLCLPVFVYLLAEGVSARGCDT